MAAAGDDLDATDPAADLERELRDRFGQPPAPVRNLLFIVRLRALARRGDVASVGREDSGGRPLLTLRTADGVDLRERIAPRVQRDLAASGGVTIGRTQLRMDLEVLGDRWRDVLVEVLEAAAGAVPA
jgi:transcription-repair coupling factor (superfamily II helicase)